MYTLHLGEVWSTAAAVSADSIERGVVRRATDVM